MNLDPKVGVADFREALRPQARDRMLEGTQLSLLRSRLIFEVLSIYQRFLRKVRASNSRI